MDEKQKILKEVNAERRWLKEKKNKKVSKAAKRDFRGRN